MKNALMEYNPISERILTARIRTKYRNITVLQCYSPTEAADNDTKDSFYEQLNRAISIAPRSDIKIVMRDMNAKVGDDNTNLQAIMGSEGLRSIRNNNGERLIDFCMGNQLFIGGSKFPHRDIHKYTWQSPDGITGNQIDHFMISRKFLGCLMDVKAIRGADIYSDHQLLVGILRLRPMANYKKPSARKKFNVHRLQQTSVAQEFTRRLCTELESHQQQPSRKNITEACIKTANDTLGGSTHHTSPWIRDATWEKIKERKAIKMELLSAEQ
ncbi:craniofacial development protein 2-like [Calliphora vicina]|uniref:craniofacial development protein 2-like n=1 Tax=Calliphora vicina TaxID=7373 RepID=UPI00325B91A4